jgi:hypothetical protein
MEKRNAYRLLVGKPEGKKPLGRPEREWVDNIKMDLGEVDCGDVDWIGLAQDRDRRRALVNAVTNFRFHKMLANYRVASQLVASRVVLSSIERERDRLMCEMHSTMCMWVCMYVCTYGSCRSYRRPLETE